MNRSIPGFPVHYQLPEPTQTHVHCISDAIQPSHPLSSPSPPALNVSQHQGLFKWASYLHQVVKVFSSVQSLSSVRLFVTPWTAACQASLFITNSQSSNWCPLSLWCYPTILSSVIPFSSRLQSFQASGSLQMSQFFASGGQSLEFQLQHQFFQWTPRTDLL